MRTPRKTIAALAVAGTLTTAGAAVAVPAIATAATSDTTVAAATTDRLTKLKNALAGLVTDGTLTQAQADKVASTLNDQLPQGGHGGRGAPGAGRGGIDLQAAAEVLGMTRDEVHEAQHAGTTLAQLAEQKGVALGTLVDRLVAAATERIDAAVTAGRLTQAQADEQKATLRDRITTAVSQARPQGRPGAPRGERGGSGSPTAPGSTPSATPTS